MDNQQPSPFHVLDYLKHAVDAVHRLNGNRFADL
jgi:hypothetical protein